MSAVLLMAAGLGLLSFFEPCTVASHTLFAARASRGDGRERRWGFAQLLVARSFLLTSLFTAAAWVGLGRMSAVMVVSLLAVTGAVYLVSRRIYLPVPHFEFFRLIPNHDRLPSALKLGLTLPACTLPLVGIVAIAAAGDGRLDIAAIAGLVFAGMFSLPTIWDGLRGLNVARCTFLSKAAIASPYLTALLLWGGALMIWRMR